MKRSDNFLRIFRRSPRKEFADDLYQRISTKKPSRHVLRQVTVWGLMGILIFYTLSATISNFSLPSTPALYDRQNTAASLRLQQHNPALAAERGLAPAAFSAPPDNNDLLGPFDKAKAEAATLQEEEGLIAMAILAERQ